MTYDISTLEVPDQAILSIRAQVEQGSLPTFIGHSLGELFSHLTDLGIEPVGEPFVIYHAFGPIELDVETCVPVAGTVATSGRMVARVLPGGSVVRTMHVGRYEDLGVAYEAVTEWVDDHDLEAVGPFRERYLDGPGDDVPPEWYRTIVEMPIAEAAVLAH